MAGDRQALPFLLRTTNLESNDVGQQAVSYIFVCIVCQRWSVKSGCSWQDNGRTTEE